MHVDAETQTITLAQKSSQFAIKPDKVTMPIVAFEMLYLNLRMQAINNTAKMQVKQT